MTESINFKPKSWTIKVTEDDIKNGTARTTSCMIANAVRNSIPGSSSVHVTSETIKFNKDGIRHCYEIPGRAGINAAQHDDDLYNGRPHTVKPFSFRIDYRQCTVAPVKQGPLNPNKTWNHRPKTKKEKIIKNCTVRRYHGKRVISG